MKNDETNNRASNILMERMLSAADPSQVAGLSRFFKTGPGQYGEGDKFLGIKVPATRDIVKKSWRDTGLEQLEECIASEYHEVRLAALLALVEIFRHQKPGQILIHQKPGQILIHQKPGQILIHQKPGQILIHQKPGQISREECIGFYLSHTEFINNWDLVDLSCYPLLGEWLLDKDRTLLYDLARNGRTIWEQRIGIVSTMTFIRNGQLADTLAIADILLLHPHDLIHKAVGWLLREAGKRDQAALEAYLQGKAPGKPDAPRYKIMPRTALRYAIERFPEELRQGYLKGMIQ